ncbi:MAG: glycosyltransferase family 2 protein [Rhodospirillales bacterium]|nr:glycosyltransferase family 2 protein [Rhodospirillales bacterium]
MNVSLRNSGIEYRFPVPAPQKPLKLSIVLPMYNERANLQGLFDRLYCVLDELSFSVSACGDILSFEFICVDDGSTDGTAEALKALRAREPRLKIIRLSRNFGKEIALAAGLRHARGDAAVIMDADLQHPPELIEALYAQWRAGYEIVYGVRENGNKASWLRRGTSRLFHRVFAVLAQSRLPEGACDFRLLDRRAVDALNALPETDRFTRGLYSWIGFRQVGVPFTVADRGAGRSGWSLVQLWRFGMDAITSFSMIPLRFSSVLGGLISIAAIAYAVFVVVKTVLYGGDLPGYPSLIVAIMFFSGVQLLSLGIIGEYLGRVFTEVKRRPLYVVAEAMGFDAVAGALAVSRCEVAAEREPT